MPKRRFQPTRGFRRVDGVKTFRLTSSDVGVANYLRDTGVIAGGGGVVDAVAGATVLALGTPSLDGMPGAIRVGAWPDMAQVGLTWLASEGRWVGDAIPLIHQTDQGYLSFSNTGGYSYLSSTTNASGSANQTGWITRSIPHAAALFGAGLKLQCCITGILAGNGFDTGSVRAYFFQHDAGDVVNTISGGAPNGQLGNSPTITGGTAVVTPGTSAGTFRTSHWQDMVLTTPTKKYIWAELFAQKNGAVNAGVCQALDVDVQVRWVSA